MFQATHFFLSAIGLVAVMSIAQRLWGMDLPFLTESLGTYDHVGFNRAKALDLILHVGGVLILSVYFAGIRAWLRSRKEQPQMRPQVWTVWLLAVGFYNGWLLQWQPAKPATGLDWLYLTAVGIVWLLFTAAPFYGPTRTARHCRRPRPNSWRR